MYSSFIICYFNMKYLLHFLFFLFFTISVFSQNIVWQRKYGGLQADRLICGTTATKGGYIFAGTIESHGQSRDIWLMKIDSSGKNVWQQTIGRGFEEEAAAITATADGGLAIIGTIRESETKSRIWVIKTDEWGNLQWDKRFGTGKALDEGLAIANAIDGGFVVAGALRSREGGQPAWMAKLDNKGNLEWEKTWGGLYANSIVTVDDHYLLGSQITDKEGNKHYRVLALSENGFPIWDATLGFEGNVEATQLLANGSETIVVGKQTKADITQAWVTALNKKGKTIWEHSYGTIGEQSAFSKGIIKDKNFLFLGEKQGKNTQQKDIYIVQTDKKGKLKQEKIVGEAENDQTACMFLLKNKQLLIGATNFTSGSADWWIFTLNNY